jgi:ribose 5-phosphate isomerase B
MQTQLKIVIGCDLAAYDFKTQAIKSMRERGYTITDIGCHSSREGDYPPVAEEVGLRVVSGEFDRGLLICGTGQGMAMAANKVKGARAALCYDILPALLSREHNNSNILATGCWMISPEKYLEMVEIWLFGKYNAGRHDVRINYMLEMEGKR